MDQVATGAGNDGNGCAPGPLPEPLFAIGTIAREFGVTLRTLRFYESRGLLHPLRRGQVRIFRQRDRERLALILCGKKLGFTLAEIGAMLACEDAPPALALNRDQCLAQIIELERRKREIESALADLRLAHAAAAPITPRRI